MFRRGIIKKNALKGSLILPGKIWILQHLPCEAHIVREFLDINLDIYFCCTISRSALFVI